MFFKKASQTKVCIVLSSLIFLPYFFNVFYKGGIGLLNHLLFFLCLGLSGIIFYIALQKKIYKERELPFYENFSLITLVILFSLSYINSLTRNVGLLELGSLYAGAILILLGYNIAQNKDQLKRLFSVFSISSLASLIIGFVFYFGDTFERFSGTFNNYFEPWSAFPNAYGDFLILIMPLTFYLVEQKKKKKAGMIAFLPEITFSLSVAAVLLTDSQGIHVAAIILFALLLGRLMIVGKFAKKLIVLSLIGLVLGLGAHALKNNLMPKYREDVEISNQVSMDAKSYEQQNSVNTRLDHFKTGFNLMLSAPLFGYGPGSYPYVSANKLTLLNNSDHPHNLFLKIGIENGILTLIAFITFIGIILLRALIIFFQKLDPAREVVFLSIVAFLAHQMIDYNLNFASVEFLFYILLGTLIIERVRKSKRLHFKELRFANHFMLVVFGIILVVFSLNDGIYNFRAAHSTNIEESFNLRSKTLLKRSYYEDYASYLKLNDQPTVAMILAGLDSNPFNDSLYALSGNYQKAYDLNPHNLKHLLGVYETASAQHKEALKKDVRKILNEYFILLKTNTSFTLLTENPIVALSLARLIYDRELVQEFELTIESEKAKFEKLYNVSL
ncbi:MAG: O-antigen ligase family protein [Candidatus Peregrinibacteria bacterium]|nr:O-antigen ligase family protein [Candidatus Peregrinibacteria bacterium]